MEGPLQHNSLDSVAQRLLVITLAIESAVQNKARGELSTLFVERESILDQLQEFGNNLNHPVLAEVERIDIRVQAEMTKTLGALRKEIQNMDQGMKAHRSYTATV